MYLASVENNKTVKQSMPVGDKYFLNLSGLHVKEEMKS